METKTLYQGCLPIETDFATLSGADRVCEIRVMIAEAHKRLRKEIPQLIKNENSFFHGQWHVWRNLMNMHPAACLEEYRTMATYFDADSDELVTEICNRIEQHIELTRQSINLNGMHQHQADAMIGISAGPSECTAMMRIGACKTRVPNPHRELAEALRKYFNVFRDNTAVPSLCTLLTKRFGAPSFDTYADSTVDEMFDQTCAAIQTTTEPVDEVYDWVCRAIISFDLPPMPVEDEGAGDENYALRS